MNRRTLQDFVEDLVSDGVPPEGVRAVASQTRWAPQARQAEEMARTLISTFNSKSRKNLNGDPA